MSIDHEPSLAEVIAGARCVDELLSAVEARGGIRKKSGDLQDLSEIREYVKR